GWVLSTSVVGGTFIEIFRPTHPVRPSVPQQHERALRRSMATARCRRERRICVVDATGERGQESQPHYRKSPGRSGTAASRHWRTASTREARNCCDRRRG